MAIVLTDFDKIWASTSPLTPYSFSDANYEEGWNFIGSTPPARQMWDSIQKFNDEKFKYIKDNYLSTVGTVVDNATTSATSLTANTAKALTSISLEAGTWIVKGKVYFSSNTADRIYGIDISTTSDTHTYSSSGSVDIHSATTGNLAIQGVEILTLSVTTTVYLNAWSNASATATTGILQAVRIV